MSDFDIFLGLQLRRMLDPIVTSPPPTRGWHKRSPQPVPIPALAVEPAGLELTAQAIPVVEPMVTLPVVPAPGI